MSPVAWLALLVGQAPSPHFQHWGSGRCKGHCLFQPSWCPLVFVIPKGIGFLSVTSEKGRDAITCTYLAVSLRVWWWYYLLQLNLLLWQMVSPASMLSQAQQLPQGMSSSKNHTSTERHIQSLGAVCPSWQHNLMQSIIKGPRSESLISLGHFSGLFIVHGHTQHQGLIKYNAATYYCTSVTYYCTSVHQLWGDTMLGTSTSTDRALHAYLGRGRKIGILIFLKLLLCYCAGCDKNNTHKNTWEVGMVRRTWKLL